MFLILDQSRTEFSSRLKGLAEQKGLHVLLLTTADVARDMAVVFHLSDKDLQLHLLYQDLAVTTRDIEGIYCGMNIFEPGLWEGFTPKDAEYAARETQALWMAVLTGLPCRVVNPPALDSLAGASLSTPEILYLAHRLGFHIPMVISLESGKVAADLLRTGVPARYADLGEIWVNETGLSRDHLGSLEQNDDHFLVVEEVPGRPVYVTILGNEFFACEADAEGSVAPLPVSLITRPVRSRLRALQKQLNLVLAEYSLRVMADGNWAFLSCVRPPIFAVEAYGDALLGRIIDYAVERGQ
jgi:hypothetical protein